jgi:hypothetical protein
MQGEWTYSSLATKNSLALSHMVASASMRSTSLNCMKAELPSICPPVVNLRLIVISAFILAICLASVRGSGSHRWYGSCSSSASTRTLPHDSMGSNRFALMFKRSE